MSALREFVEEAINIAEVRAKHIQDDRIDRVVQALCETYGYGAVLDSAARLWLKKDPHGALIVAGAMGAAKNLLSEGEAERSS